MTNLLVKLKMNTLYFTMAQVKEDFQMEAGWTNTMCCQNNIIKYFEEVLNNI